MKNRLYLGCGVLVVAAVGVLCWCTGRYVFRPLPPEPTYRGIVEPSAGRSEMERFFDGGNLEPVYEVHPLSYWLTQRYIFRMDDGVSVTSWGPPRSPLPTSLLNDSNAVPFLIKALRRDSWVGQAYYRKLLWPKLPPRIKAHLPTPPADNWQIRQNSAGFLSRMGPIAKPSIPALARALKEDDGLGVRQNAAWALGNLGNGDKTAMAALTEAARKDVYPPVHWCATKALWHLAPEGVVAGLTEALKDKDRNGGTRLRAAYDLVIVAEGDKAAIAVLKGALSGKDGRVQIFAALALCDNMHAEDPDAVTVMKGALSGANKAAAAALAQALKDDDALVRKAATNALLKIDPEAAAMAGVKRPSP